MAKISRRLTIKSGVSALCALGMTGLPAKAGMSPPPISEADLAAGFADRWNLIKSIDLSLKYLGSAAAQQTYPRLGISLDLMTRSLRRFREITKFAINAQTFARQVNLEFALYQVDPRPDTDTVLITGYYHPIFKASLTRNDVYRYPLYVKPRDLVLDRNKQPLGQQTANGLKPYPTRGEIERQNLLTGQELAYLSDPLERFLVHIEGSAQLQLTNGTTRQVGFVAKSGRQYSSVGKALIADGKVPADRMSLDGMKRFFRENPDQIETYLYKNEAYVFFDWADAGGPYGCLGLPVTAMHSAAMDKDIFPPGGLVFIQADLADGPLRQFVLDQDSGSAIKGRGRLDLYVGAGLQAEKIAGNIKTPASLYYLLLKA
ncbi:MAG: MltA domain-containing protein [Anaerolineae bacterium]|nr:MltA domain-containing protein [Gloeobacterales cyanobacterium ES-bin-313]